MTRPDHAEVAGSMGDRLTTKWASLEPREDFGAGVARNVAQVFLDADQLVVLCRAIRARQRTGLDLTGRRWYPPRDRQSVSPRSRLSDAKSRYVSGALGPFQPRQTVSDKVPIWLILIRIGVGDALWIPSRRIFRIGHEDIVADQLHLLAEPVGQRLPAVPVAFGHAVFDADNRVARRPVSPQINQLGAAQRAAFAFEVIFCRP